MPWRFLATNPFKFLVVTTSCSYNINDSCTHVLYRSVGLMGGYLNVHSNELTSLTTFFQKAFESITFLDIFSSLIKSVLFGFTIGIVGSYMGYNATQGTQGVGKAANASVVAAMFLVFIEEIIAVQITNWFR